MGPSGGGRPISTPITMGFPSRSRRWWGSPPYHPTLQLNSIYCRSSSTWRNQQNPSNNRWTSHHTFKQHLRMHRALDNASKAYTNPSYLQPTVDTFNAEPFCIYFDHRSHRNMETRAGPSPPYVSTSRRERIGSTDASSVSPQQWLIRQKRSWTRGRYP